MAFAVGTKVDYTGVLPKTRKKFGGRPGTIVVAPDKWNACAVVQTMEGQVLLHMNYIAEHKEESEILSELGKIRELLEVMAAKPEPIKPTINLSIPNINVNPPKPEMIRVKVEDLRIGQRLPMTTKEYQYPKLTRVLHSVADDGLSGIKKVRIEYANRHEIWEYGTTLSVLAE